MVSNSVYLLSVVLSSSPILSWSLDAVSHHNLGLTFMPPPPPPFSGYLLFASF